MPARGDCATAARSMIRLRLSVALGVVLAALVAVAEAAPPKLPRGVSAVLWDLAVPGGVEPAAGKVLLGEMDLLEVAALDPSADPKCIDFKAAVDIGELRKGTVYESIYKFDGDALILAVHMGEAKARPAKFEAPKDSKVVLVTLKRVKK